MTRPIAIAAFVAVFVLALIRSFVAPRQAAALALSLTLDVKPWTRVTRINQDLTYFYDRIHFAEAAMHARVVVQ